MAQITDVVRDLVKKFFGSEPYFKKTIKEVATKKEVTTTIATCNMSTQELEKLAAQIKESKTPAEAMRILTKMPRYQLRGDSEREEVLDTIFKLVNDYPSIIKDASGIVYEEARNAWASLKATILKMNSLARGSAMSDEKIKATETAFLKTAPETITMNFKRIADGDTTLTAKQIMECMREKLSCDELFKGTSTKTESLVSDTEQKNDSHQKESSLIGNIGGNFIKLFRLPFNMAEVCVNKFIEAAVKYAAETVPQCPSYYYSSIWNNNQRQNSLESPISQATPVALESQQLLSTASLPTLGR